MYPYSIGPNHFLLAWCHDSAPGESEWLWLCSLALLSSSPSSSCLRSASSLSSICLDLSMCSSIVPWFGRRAQLDLRLALTCFRFEAIHCPLMHPMPVRVCLNRAERMMSWPTHARLLFKEALHQEVPANFRSTKNMLIYRRF